MAATNIHGPQVLPGSVRFRLWAPGCERIDLELTEGARALLKMDAVGNGWHEVTTERAGPGTRYCFALPDGLRVPDPASRFQPETVHGPSEVIDSASWRWDDGGWRGRPWEELVIYELHTGAFTPEGTFRAAITKLDHLVALGVTAIELMPVAAFPGERNWGYDGVALYAPANPYGRPEDLKALVESAHRKGISMLLDAVYNHFGPEGNYLPIYAPDFFTRRHETPWGAAVNYDSAGSEAVREFVIENALFWLNQYRFDGLRLDAVHAIIDDGPESILAELAGRIRSTAWNRPIHLILENERNEAHWLERGADGAPHRYTAQWNDDVHHVLHAAATGENTGYYHDYLGDTEKLGRALAEGFAFQGEFMSYRGRERGEPAGHLPPSAFVAFLQNHDQIGNRAFGERISAIAIPKAVRAAAAVYLLLPQTPMLFMGEEWNASQPFPFFCDFGPDLADAVTRGRRSEFSRFPEFQDPEQRERIPNPQARETFEMAKLDWNEILDSGHREWLLWYREIIEARRKSVLPLIPSIRSGGKWEILGDGAVLVHWRAEYVDLVLAANLSNLQIGGLPLPASLIWQEGERPEPGGALQPWTVLWWTAEHAESREAEEERDDL